MKLIQNENLAFRLPNTLKEKLIAYADENELHVAAVIRKACSAFLKQEEIKKGNEQFLSSDWWKMMTAEEDGGGLS